VRRRLVFVWVVSLASACSRPAPHVDANALERAPREAGHWDAPRPAADAGPVVVDSGRDAVALPDDPYLLHLVTKDELRALALAGAGVDAGGLPPSALATIAPEPGRFNQGNKALARHARGRATCLGGLQGVTLQTNAQRAQCHDKANMVPVFRGGDPASAKACIDVFEFPNEACALPFVWGTPMEADQLCRAEGKRLCSQPEWTLACAGDPAGAPDRAYAYGDELDLTVCNTNKPHPFGPDGETWLCSAQSAETAWATCATETEPSGAFPACRSRFGVYDLHGNVAEIMSRTTQEGERLTQLKGSAFFYVDVARQPSETQQPGHRETYPDHCQYDPRWHVEDLKVAKHSNYHLGFRCCLGI
jgi:sulfatase modifying factor 1